MSSYARQSIPSLLACVALAACAETASAQCPGGICRRPAAIAAPAVVAWQQPAQVVWTQQALSVQPVAVTWSQPQPHRTESAPVTWYPQYPAVIQTGTVYYYQPVVGGSFVPYYPGGVLR